LAGVKLCDDHWQHSGLQALVVMNRETYYQSSQQTTNETSYYPGNYQNDDKQRAVESLVALARGVQHLAARRHLSLGPYSG